MNTSVNTQRKLLVKFRRCTLALMNELESLVLDKIKIEKNINLDHFEYEIEINIEDHKSLYKKLYPVYKVENAKELDPNNDDVDYAKLRKFILNITNFDSPDYVDDEMTSKKLVDHILLTAYPDINIIDGKYVVTEKIMYNHLAANYFGFKTGIEGLDVILKGKLMIPPECPVSMAFAGQGGAGKSSLALHISSQAASNGDFVIYYTLEQNPIDLTTLLENYNLGPENNVEYLLKIVEDNGEILDAIKESKETNHRKAIGVLCIQKIDRYTFAGIIEQVEELTETISKEKRYSEFQRKFVFIDSLNAIGDFRHDDPSWRDQTHDIISVLEENKFNCAFLLERVLEGEDDYISYLTDIVFKLYIPSYKMEKPGYKKDKPIEVLRTIEVSKNRFQKYLEGRHPFYTVHGSGLKVYPSVSALHSLYPRRRRIKQVQLSEKGNESEVKIMGFKGFFRDFHDRTYQMAPFWFKNSITLVKGEIGSNKSTFSRLFSKTSFRDEDWTKLETTFTKNDEDEPKSTFFFDYRYQEPETPEKELESILENLAFPNNKRISLVLNMGENYQFNPDKDITYETFFGRVHLPNCKELSDKKNNEYKYKTYATISEIIMDFKLGYLTDSLYLSVIEELLDSSRKWVVTEEIPKTYDKFLLQKKNLPFKAYSIVKILGRAYRTSQNHSNELKGFETEKNYFFSNQNSRFFPVKKLKRIIDSTSEGNEHYEVFVKTVFFRFIKWEKLLDKFGNKNKKFSSFLIDQFGKNLFELISSNYEGKNKTKINDFLNHKDINKFMTIAVERAKMNFVKGKTERLYDINKSLLQDIQDSINNKLSEVSNLISSNFKPLYPVIDFMIIIVNRLYDFFIKNVVKNYDRSFNNPFFFITNSTNKDQDKKIEFSYITYRNIKQSGFYQFKKSDNSWLILENDIGDWQIIISALSVYNTNVSKSIWNFLNRKDNESLKNKLNQHLTSTPINQDLKETIIELFQLLQKNTYLIDQQIVNRQNLDLLENTFYENSLKYPTLDEKIILNRIILESMFPNCIKKKEDRLPLLPYEYPVLIDRDSLSLNTNPSDTPETIFKQIEEVIEKIQIDFPLDKYKQSLSSIININSNEFSDFTINLINDIIATKQDNDLKPEVITQNFEKEYEHNGTKYKLKDCLLKICKEKTAEYRYLLKRILLELHLNDFIKPKLLHLVIEVNNNISKIEIQPSDIEISYLTTRFKNNSFKVSRVVLKDLDNIEQQFPMINTSEFIPALCDLCIANGTTMLIVGSTSNHAPDETDLQVESLADNVFVFGHFFYRTKSYNIMYIKRTSSNTHYKGILEIWKTPVADQLESRPTLQLLTGILTGTPKQLPIRLYLYEGEEHYSRSDIHGLFDHIKRKYKDSTDLPTAFTFDNANIKLNDQLSPIPQTSSFNILPEERASRRFNKFIVDSLKFNMAHDDIGLHTNPMFFGNLDFIQEKSFAMDALSIAMIQDYRIQDHATSFFPISYYYKFAKPCKENMKTFAYKLDNSLEEIKAVPISDIGKSRDCLLIGPSEYYQNEFSCHLNQEEPNIYKKCKKCKICISSECTKESKKHSHYLDNNLITFAIEKKPSENKKEFKADSQKKDYSKDKKVFKTKESFCHLIALPCYWNPGVILVNWTGLLNKLKSFNLAPYNKEDIKHYDEINNLISKLDTSSEFRMFHKFLIKEKSNSLEKPWQKIINLCKLLEKKNKPLNKNCRLFHFRHASADDLCAFFIELLRDSDLISKGTGRVCLKKQFGKFKRNNNSTKAFAQTLYDLKEYADIYKPTAIQDVLFFREWFSTAVERMRLLKKLNPNDDYRIFPMRNYAVKITMYMGVVKGSPRRKVGSDIVNYLCSPQVANQIFTNGIGLPPTKEFYLESKESYNLNKENYKISDVKLFQELKTPLWDWQQTFHESISLSRFSCYSTFAPVLASFFKGLLLSLNDNLSLENQNKEDKLKWIRKQISTLADRMEYTCKDFCPGKE